MLKTQQLSEAATAIVNKLVKEFGGSPFSNEYADILKSLYASLPNADEYLLELVGECIDLYEEVSADELKVLHDERAAVASFCIDNIHSSRGRYFDEFFISKELIELCKGINEIKSGSDVFLPFAGMAEFAYDLPECNISGYEINARTWALSQIAFNLIGRKVDIELRKDIPALAKKEHKYDVIFLFPPILKGPNAYSVIYEIRELATKSLKDDGVMFCLLPVSFCNDTYIKGWFKVREILFDYIGQYTAAVISLPQIFPTTSANFCLFCLIKDKGDKVILVDATDLYTVHQVAKRKFNTLNPDAILEVIKKQDELHVWVGHASHLAEGLNLTPQRYLIENHVPVARKGEQVIPLADLIEFVDLDVTSIAGIWPTIRFSSLSTNYLDCEIIENEGDFQSEYIYPKLTKDCLLAAFVGNSMKVGKIRGLSRLHCVALHHGILAFNLKSELITEDYLLRCLVSQETNAQARCFASGKVTSSMKSGDDFLKIKVLVPSLDEQARICRNDALKGLSDATRQQVEANEVFRQNMHLVKHSIGQSIANLNNWWRVLQRARKEGGGIVDDRATVGNFKKTSVSEIYENLQLAIEQLQNKVSKFDRSYGLKTKNLPITEFIEKYIAEHESSVFTYEYDSIRHHADHTILELTDEGEPTGKIVLNEGDPIEYAQFSPEALTIVFDNIISNAVAHGFKGRENEKNIVRIELTLVGDSYVIAISNNGNSVSNDFTQREVFAYGMSTATGTHNAAVENETHFGIGGFEVNNIMNEFGDRAEFESTPDEEFTVTYRLILNNTNIVSVEL